MTLNASDLERSNSSSLTTQSLNIVSQKRIEIVYVMLLKTDMNEYDVPESPRLYSYISSEQPYMYFRISNGVKHTEHMMMALFKLFFFFLVPATSPLTQYLKAGCSESDQTWQSRRSP